MTKIGTGTLFLTVDNAYGGPTTIRGGTLNVGSTAAIAAGGAGGVTFAGGTLQYTAAGATVDYSGNIVNSTGPIAIDTNGQSVTFGGALASSNVGGFWPRYAARGR